MARYWVFFEHLDSLPLVNLQIIIKEIQIVQQQYIIAELNNLDLMAEGNLIGKGIHIDENKTAARESLLLQRSKSQERIADNAHKQLTRRGSLVPAA